MACHGCLYGDFQFTELVDVLCELFGLFVGRPGRTSYVFWLVALCFLVCFLSGQTGRPRPLMGTVTK